MVGLDNSSAAATLVDSSWVPPLLIIHVIYGQSRKEKKKVPCWLYKTFERNID